MSRATTQTVQRQWGKLHATLTPVLWGCCWEPFTELNWNLGMKIVVHQAPFCLSVSRVRVQTITCQYSMFLWASYLYHSLHLIFCGKLTGLDTLHSSSYIIPFQLSVSPLFPCAMEQKLSLEWLEITLLTFCPLPFMFKKGFIYLLISISFWGYMKEYWHHFKNWAATIFVSRWVLTGAQVPNSFKQHQSNTQNSTDTNMPSEQI